MMDSSPLAEFDLTSLLESLDPDIVRNRYFDLLRIENKRKNLVSRETIENGLDRLFAESLSPFVVSPDLADLGSIGRYLDIGSGGGFPAIPILMTKTVRQSLLIERRNTKGEALNRMLEQLNIKGEISNIDFGQKKPPGNFDFVTMRLVRLTTPILKSILGLLSEDGIFLYYSKLDPSIIVPQLSVKGFRFTIDNSPNPKSFTVIKKQL